MTDNKTCADGFVLGYRREYLNRSPYVVTGACLLQACQAHPISAVTQEDITALELGVLYTEDNLRAAKNQRMIQHYLVQTPAAARSLCWDILSALVRRICKCWVLSAHELQRKAL